METADLFIYEYNRLDSFLRNLVNGSDKTNYISYFEKILSEKKRAECETVRKFKNIIESHSVCPGCKKPEVPIEWVNWLRHALDYCKNNQAIVKSAILKQLNSKEHHFKPHEEKKSESYQDYYRNLYSNPISLPKKLSRDGEEVKVQLKMMRKYPANNYDDIVGAYKRIVDTYDFEDFCMIYSSYNCTTPFKKGKMDAAKEELAEKLAADLNDDDLKILCNNL